MDPKLKELSEKSTIEVETSKRRFYWQADGYKFNNVNLARWYEKENKTWVEFVDNQLDLIRQNLSTQTFDPNKDYNVECDDNILKVLHLRQHPTQRPEHHIHYHQRR